MKIVILRAYSAGNHRETLDYQKNATAVSKFMVNGSNFDLIKKVNKVRGLDMGEGVPFVGRLIGFSQHNIK